MTGFFLALCTLLSNILNPIILMLMIFELGLGVIVGWQLVRLRREINRLNASGHRKNRETRREGRGKLTTTFESITEKDWNDFDAFLGQYQKDVVTYNLFSLLLEIFPLLGILGTVAGLYIAINNGQDIYTGVKFALSSTVYGIMAAVLFKIADIIFTARFLNYIDDGIDRFEKNYSIVSQEAQTNREQPAPPEDRLPRAAAAPGVKPPAKAASLSAASGAAPALPPDKKPAEPSGSLADDGLLFPESESLRKSQQDAKNVADMISGWRKTGPAPAGGDGGSDTRPEM